MNFIDFQQLQNEQERFRIIEVAAWGGDTIRLNRLNAAECITLINLQDDIEENTDDGKVKDPVKNIAWAVEVCSRLIADEAGELQFNTDSGRDFLSLEYAALNEILPHAISLLELDGEVSPEKKSE